MMMFWTLLISGLFGSSGGLYTLHGVWERPPANNLPQTPHSAGAYDIGYVLYKMSNEMFWTSMVQGDNSVSGLEDLNFPLTNET